MKEFNWVDGNLICNNFVHPDEISDFFYSLSAVVEKKVLPTFHTIVLVSPSLRDISLALQQHISVRLTRDENQSVPYRKL